MSEKSRENYCLGFIFTDDQNLVLLLQRQKPEWQKGKWSGVGGHIEANESPKEAMARECLEETGHSIPSNKWKYFCNLEGQDYMLHCFSVTLSAYELLEFRFDKPTHDEGPNSLFSVNNLPDSLDDVPWLVKMAIDTRKNNCFYSIRTIKAINEFTDS